VSTSDGTWDGGVIDGLQVGEAFAPVFGDPPPGFSQAPTRRLDDARTIFEQLREGGFTAVNCTCSIWEDASRTLENIAAFKNWMRRYPDLVLQVSTTADISEARASNRVGVILGWQNTSAIEDKLHLMPLFAELGVRIVQLTYNTGNWVGAGCFESVDHGLTDFGRELIAELNELKIAIDVSHVGGETTSDAIAASAVPVVCTHAGPAALHPTPRNKTDAQLRAVAESGGVTGLFVLPWFLAAGSAAGISDYVDTIEHVIRVAGEDHAAIGSDYIHGRSERYFDFLLRDKGYGRRHAADSVMALVEAALPSGLDDVSRIPQNLVGEMRRRRWSDARIEKVLGLNWLRVFGEIWDEPPAARTVAVPTDEDRA
jgi:membrane dipeptidase